MTTIMNETFELRTTMSAKPLRRKVHIKKLSILSLKKNIRRSSCYGKSPAALDDTLYIKENKLIETKNDISTELQFDTDEPNLEESCTMFADLSIIPKDVTMMAMNSTFIEGRRTCFHELFQGSKETKRRSPNRKYVEPSVGKMYENRKILEDKNGPRSRIRENEVPKNHTEPKKKISTRINQVHKVVCQTETKLNFSKQGDQHNLVSRNGKQLFVQEPSLRHSPKNGRLLYSCRSESDTNDDLRSKETLRIVNPEVVVKSISDIKEKIQINEENSCKISNFYDSERCLINKPKELSDNNVQRIHTVVSERVATSNSDDELISQRYFQRIVHPKSVKKRSFKKNTDTQDNVLIINNNETNLKHSKISEHIDTNKFEANEIIINADFEIVISSDSEDELLATRKFKRIIHPKADFVQPKNHIKIEATQKDMPIKDTDQKFRKSYCSESTSNKTENIISTSSTTSKELCTSYDKLNCNTDSEILVLSDSDDSKMKTIKKIECIPEYIKNEPTKRNSNEIDIEKGSVDEVRKILDEIYGSSWRENEDRILRTEPRNRISTKVENVFKAVNKTEVKRVESNYRNIHGKLNFPLFNEAVTTKNIYTESPELKSLTIPKKIERRKLFQYVDSDDEDFDRNPELTTKLKNVASTVQSITSKTVATPLLKSTSYKPSAKINLCDSESETENIVASDDCSIDSDLETPKRDYLPKYLKSTEVKGSTQKKEKTFLESLSKSVPIFEAHPTARIFRNDYKKHRDELASRLFKLFNKEVFDSVIPTDTSIEWNTRLRGTAGTCKNKKVTNRDKVVCRTVTISLSNKVLDTPDRLRDTLIHEMCHAANWITDGERGHGPSWRKWAVKASRVFPELPPISTCHNYNIATKYTYRCTECAYSFGRHSKSISIEKKCCGYCRGKLELLVNKISKPGLTSGITAVSATPPRKPTGFALFVKDNYKTCKTPDVKHGDVMRLLSKQFSSLKVEKTVAI